MARLLLLIAMLAASVTAQAQPQDLHLQEAGSAAVLAHSTFAHGYRHGYEEGYHAGNTDINMGRLPRAKISDLRGVKSGYVSQFGSHAVFEKGFHAGLKAGYNDGYLGRSFRAVETLRSVAGSLEETPFPADADHTRFDQGFLAGYNNGLASAGERSSSVALMDFRSVACAEVQPVSGDDKSGTGNYCDGYRRGFVLGHADGFMQLPNTSRMEASK